MSTYQMLWDCSRCSTEKLLGVDHRFCPACGAPQDPAQRYFPEEADKVEAADHAYAGADVACPSCSTANSARAEFCVGCGSPMEGGGSVGTRGDQVSDTGGAFAGDNAQVARDEHRGVKQADEAARREAMAGGGEKSGGGGGAGKAAMGLGIGAVGLVGIGLFVLTALCCGLMFWSHDADLQVTGHSWARAVPIEAEKLVRKEAWKEDVPSKARNVSCKKKKQSTKKIKDGEDCKTRRVDRGDGTFKEKKECTPRYREEPVYGQHCSYQIMAWTTVRTEKASGKALKPAPSWPKVKLSRGQREGKRTETYTVKLKEADGTGHQCSTNQKRWGSMTKGSTWTGSVGVVTGSVDCDDLTKK